MIDRICRFRKQSISGRTNETVQMAKELGFIIENPNGAFELQRTITRAEVVTILTRFIRNIAK